MINALNLKLQLLITSLRLLKKPTQTYFLECKMLLIKYFSNTKASCFETQEFSSGRVITTKVSIAGNGPCTTLPARVKPDTPVMPWAGAPAQTPPSFVQTHAEALVHAHVRIAKQSSSTALDPSGV